MTRCRSGEACTPACLSVASICDAACVTALVYVFAAVVYVAGRPVYLCLMCVLMQHDAVYLLTCAPVCIYVT